MSNPNFPLTGRAIVISAPSGGGKTSITNEIIKRDKICKKSISFTTRKKRESEIDGIDYHFVSVDEFKKHLLEGNILEYTNIYNNFYGTLKEKTISILSLGKDLILNLCPMGAESIKKNFPKNSLLIYIIPPSIEILKERLLLRGENNQEDFDIRMKEAKDEILNANKYDYTIINDKFENAVEEIYRIIQNTKN